MAQVAVTMTLSGVLSAAEYADFHTDMLSVVEKYPALEVSSTQNFRSDPAKELDEISAQLPQSTDSPTHLTLAEACDLLRSATGVPTYAALSTDILGLPEWSVSSWRSASKNGALPHKASVKVLTDALKKHCGLDVVLFVDCK